MPLLLRRNLTGGQDQQNQHAIPPTTITDSLIPSYQVTESSLVNILKELTKAWQVKRQYRMMSALPCRSTANAIISSTPSVPTVPAKGK